MIPKWLQFDDDDWIMRITDFENKGKGTEEKTKGTQMNLI